MSLPPYLPPHISLALSVFTEDELSHLTAVHLAHNAITPLHDCEFIGIRYVPEDGTSMKFADKKKAEAIRVLEDHYVEEAKRIDHYRAKWLQEEIRLWGEHLTR